MSAKIRRLMEGGRPRVLDLFSGCGGLSLGFMAAGFAIAAGVEFDPRAAESHGANFHPGERNHALPRDITALSPAELADTLGLGPVTRGIDVIVGGPPCQAFARVGRPKLREIESHPEAFIRDPRARLYLEYLAYVEAFQPLALLMENVPDVLNHGGQNIAEETCEVLRDRGYVAGYTLLNAAFYGVPQMRERMILVAYRRELGIEPSFPRPTRFLQLPRGYTSSRRVALKLLNEAPEGGVNSYHSPAAPSPELPPAITAHEALGDLPKLTAHLEGGSRRGRRPLDATIDYATPVVPEGSYASLMRQWTGPATAGGVTAHVIRHLPRDWRIFARLRPGDEYPEAHAAACVLFREELERLSAMGAAPEPGSEAHETLRAAFVPPYDVGKFPNKWRKMEPDLPARTLMAHLGKDSYSHIHYDSAQARTISVREAARLQSFPDSFTFSGAMNAAFRQIGNAVPPILAHAVAEEMSRSLAGLGAVPAAPRPR